MRYSFLILVAVVLSGCVMSEAEFKEMHTVLRENPKIAAKLERECIADGKRDLSRDEREAISVLFDTKPTQLDKVICSRLIRSAASGKMTYRDYKDIKQGRLNARVVRILKGA